MHTLSFRKSRQFALILAMLIPGTTRAQAPADAKCDTPVVLPKPIMSTHTRPPRPADAGRATGTTVLRIHIGADGALIDAQVEKSSGTASLDDAAVAWVKPYYRWEPAMRNCRPVDVTTFMSVVW
jgi:TonB family protein